MRSPGVLAVFLLGQWSASAAQVAEGVFRTEARTLQDLQEIATAVRTVAGIRQVGLNDKENSITIRGSGDEVRLGEWLVAALDRPGKVAQEYIALGSADDRFRVFHLEHAHTARDLQEMATLVRSIADAQYVYVCSRTKALVLRGNAWRISLAQWLIGELDQPPNAPAPVDAREFRLPAGPDIIPPEDVFVRIFYPGSRTTEELARILGNMRSSVKMLPRSFLNSARGAIIVRASAEKIAAAEQAVKNAR